jgi:hypothetical protein
MKSILIHSFAAAAGLLALTACTTVEQTEPATRSSTTTTTERTSVLRPVPTTVETQTVRSY